LHHPVAVQNWLFGPAWSVFYTSMGVASWFVLKQSECQIGGGTYKAGIRLFYAYSDLAAAVVVQALSV
jgi:tryptophan-rich sensory protein